MSESLKKIWNEASNSVVRDSNGILIHFKCKYCAKEIVRQDYFKLHLHRQHYNDLNIEQPPKDHKCQYEQCPYSFFTKGELSSHIRNKHTKATCATTNPGTSRTIVSSNRNNATLAATQNSQTIIVATSPLDNAIKIIPSHEQQRIVAASSKGQLPTVKLTKPLKSSFFIISPNTLPLSPFAVLNSSPLSTNSLPLMKAPIYTANQNYQTNSSSNSNTEHTKKNYTNVNDTADLAADRTQSTAAACSILNERNLSPLLDQMIDDLGNDRTDNESEVTSSTDEVNDCMPISIEKVKDEEIVMLNYENKHGRFDLNCFWKKIFKFYSTQKTWFSSRKRDEK